MLCYWTTLFTAPLLLFSAVDRAYSTRGELAFERTCTVITCHAKDFASGEETKFGAIIIITALATNARI